MTAPQSLAAWLLERVAEDEAVAASAVGRGIVWTRLADDVAGHDANSGWHVLRWRPERVLAQCAAVRAAIDWAAPLVSGVRHENEDGRDLLQILSTQYADHPGYRDEWRP